MLLTSWGFLDVPRGDESSLMTTMHMSYGRHRWLCLSFGISSTPAEDWRNFLESCSNKNIKLNQSKQHFKLRQVRFMGNVIIDRGMEADPDKIAAIYAMAPTQNKAGVQRFLVMASYLITEARLSPTQIPPLSGHKHNMKHLRKPKASIPPHQCSNIMTNKPVTPQVDASEENVGGALLQPNG